MSIERKIVAKPKKRDQDQLIEKHKRIGELLGLEKVPTHTLSWKEPNLELDTADCYPIVDVLEKIAELIKEKASRYKGPMDYSASPAKKPGRPKKVK